MVLFIMDIVIKQDIGITNDSLDKFCHKFPVELRSQ